MTVVHIVLFEWKASLTTEQIDEAFGRMLSLREKCIHPTTQKPYIKSFTGGKNNSPEGKASPQTHGFVVEFDTVEDRDYYVFEDPAHQEFVKYAGEVVESVKVFDYEPGKF